MEDYSDRVKGLADYFSESGVIDQVLTVEMNGSRLMRGITRLLEPDDLHLNGIEYSPKERINALYLAAERGEIGYKRNNLLEVFYKL